MTDHATALSRPDDTQEALAGFPAGVAWIDGAYVSMAEARIPVLDWGFLRSDATYDVVHVWKGKFFRLDAHIERFLSSIDKLRMRLPFDRNELEHILHSCVARAGFQDAYVEMICTRGHSPTFSRDPREAINRFIAFAIPFGWIASEEQRKRGLSLWIASVTRIPPSSVDPTIKNYHWLDLVKGIFEAYDNGAENVVLSDGAGNVTEGAGYNIFAVKDGKVFTPERGVLEGITRRTALELCAELGLETQVAALPEASLRSADEIFITSTAGGIMPVTRIDGALVGKGVPGPLTLALTELYWRKHDDPAWTTPVDYQAAPAGAAV